MKIYTINTEFFKLDGGAMFGVVPKSIWKNLNAPDPNNLCTWAMRCLLVHIPTTNSLVLIDTGIGNKQSDKFFSHYEPHGNYSLLSSLKALSIEPEQITDVVLTHLHFDHCGGAVSKNENGSLTPTFKNARYWTNEQHWQAANNPNAREKASFLPENFVPLLEHQQLKFATNGQQLFEGFSVHFVYGHTQAMMLPHLQYKNKTLVYCADLIPSAAHIPLPYVMAYDTQPLLSLTEKKEYLTKAADKEHILFFEHDPTHECATVQHTPKGVALQKTFSVVDI